MKETRDVLWSEHTRQELREIAQQEAVVILPIASTEQHGLHLPVDTDQRTVNHIAVEAARRLDDVPVLVAPTIPYGVSLHHMMYGGTITLRVETTIAMLSDICCSIAQNGFQRIIILSGHGGNRDTIGAAALQLRHELGRQVQGFCWFDLIPEALAEIAEGPCQTVGHSGEAETSAIQYLAPELVREDHLRWVEGTTDDPSIATPAKGERVLEAAIHALANYVRAMQQKPGDAGAGIERVRDEAE